MALEVIEQQLTRIAEALETLAKTSPGQQENNSLLCSDCNP